MGKEKKNDQIDRMQQRREELIAAFANVDGAKQIIYPMIEDMVFLEARLEALRKLPFIRVNPRNAADQIATPAARQYKELLQQYNNCLKIASGMLGQDESGEESPLRTFVNNIRK